ncbi:MAG TPA: hypothetical protein VNZ64_01855 [Candidatus Acidoferrum sp.]|jgi:hypothetical protein|nr:hypothetical protein [Candidatus Acidoferrum sp.]
MMFKLFWNGGEAARHSSKGWLPWLASPLLALLVLFLPITTGCRTAFSPLPPLNLKDPGWTVHEGQAVWSMEHGKGEIAGEVLVASGGDASTFVQFTKTPFPFVIARSTASRWEVQFPAQNRHYSGRGQPPKRLIWLYLPRVLAGKPPPRNWAWHDKDGIWRLENLASGERLEGYFTR